MRNRVGFCVKIEIDGRNAMFRSGIRCSMHAHSVIGCVFVHEYICVYLWMCVCICVVSHLCLARLKACVLNKTIQKHL